MATRTLQTEKNITFFITFTCFKWLNLFDLTNLYDDIYKWFDVVTKLENKLLGYVIMPNHLHALILLRDELNTINELIAEGKKFRAWEIVKRLKEKNLNHILKILSEGVTNSMQKKGSRHKVFTDSFDCKRCYDSNFIQQKLNYIHWNPVKAGLVPQPEDYLHSSAGFYLTEKQ
ncbi:MAG: transposase, partial [Chitinophagales bacterium]